MERQRIENMRGEVEFRRRLFQQQVEGREIFDDELGAEEIEAVLRERMDATVRDIAALRSQGITVTPYVEIGAERGQRALALENRLGCRGAAVDLSLDLLRSCEHYARRFEAAAMPLRVCADAYRLPFATGSLPFVFCYQTLHHFPDPDPIVEEIHRVLAPGGHFFFAEEPYKRLLHLELYSFRVGSRTSGRRGIAKKVFQRLFGREITREEEFGVVENHEMSVARWRRAVSRFEDVKLSLSSVGLRAELGEGGSLLRRGIATLAGGLISGVCRKAGRLEDRAASVEEALVSPTGPDAPLRRRGPEWECPATGETFPVADGVAVLMREETRRSLYPQLPAAGTAS